MIYVFTWLTIKYYFCNLVAFETALVSVSTSFKELLHMN